MAAPAPKPPVAAPPKPAASPSPGFDDLFAPESVSSAPKRASEEHFDAFVAGRAADPAPGGLRASPAPTESLKAPVTTSSDDGAREAARHEQSPKLVDSDGTHVKSAIRGGGEAWDPFLTDPEPTHRRFSRNGASSDLDKLTSSREKKFGKKKKEKVARPVTTHERQQHQTLGQWFKEILVLGLIAILTAVLLTNYVVQAFFIPSESMEDTLVVDDRVLVNKLAYKMGEPRPGDLVVFTSPEKATVAEPEAGLFGDAVNEVAQGLGLRSSVQDLIKRVIAVEGQTVEVKIGSVFVDGKQIEEPYRKDFLPMPDFPPTKVPEGKVFVMGDNRFQSHDSRSFGPVDADTIVGRAFALIWPVNRFRWFTRSE
jgi:signal peptidase I